MERLMRRWMASVGSLVSLCVFCGQSPTANDAGTDGSTGADVTSDKQVTPDGGSDGASKCPSGLACEVCDNGYTPWAMAAPYAHAAVCTPADITAFVTACGANMTTTDAGTSCDAWQTAEGNSAPNCLGCIYSNQTDPKWGVYACDNNGCLFNSGGCVDVVTGQVAQEKQAKGPGSCGDIMDANNGCQDYACGNCANAEYNTCITSVTANACKVYDDPVTMQTGACSVLAAADASAVATCDAATDADLNAMATTMCGN
jgi:hypothetical protein